MLLLIVLIAFFALAHGGEILKADVKVVTDTKEYSTKNAANSWIPIKTVLNDRFKRYVNGNRATGKFLF